MKVSIDIVKAMNPCPDRFNNFVNKYPNFEGEVKQFLDLGEITYSDKMWVVIRLMTGNQKVKFAVLCSESVLHIFEAKRPGDNRVRELLDYLKSVPNFDDLTPEQLTKIRELRQSTRDAVDAAYAADYTTYAAATKEEQRQVNLTLALKVIEEG